MAHFSELERSYFQSGFKFLNSSGDGKLTEEQLSEAVTMLRMDVSKQMVSDMIQVADQSKPKTGDVSEAEYMKMFKHKEMSAITDVIDRAFAIIAGENVKVSKGDLKEFFSGIGQKVTDEEIDEIMEIGGTGGKISKDDFVKMLEFAE